MKDLDEHICVSAVELYLALHPHTHTQTWHHFYFAFTHSL